MIHILQGDATSPNVSGVKLIAHICNDQNLGAWGSGFVLAVSAKWKKPEEMYRRWAAGDSVTDMTGGQLVLTPPIFRLGEVQIVQVEPELFVANMIGQKLYGKDNKDPRPPIRYEALIECLEQLRERANKLGATVHCPRIGCERAGASWAKVQGYIENHLVNNGLDAYVYDFPGSKFNP